MELNRIDLNNQRGYVPSETAQGQTSKDIKEFYHIGRDLPAEKLNALGMCENVWPSAGDFKPAMLDLYQALDRFSVPLEEAIAEALGQPKTLFTDMTQEGDSLLRAIHYPSNPPKDSIWGAAHTDINLITLLPRATAEGLQVQNKEGEWISVKVPDGALIVNAGDMLENITNGYFRSARHRVVDPGKRQDRYSMVIFIHPRSNDRLDPLPECVALTGGALRYPKATRWELLMVRLVELGIASPALLEQTASSGIIERMLDVGMYPLNALKALNAAGLANDRILEALQENG